jgi:hypothetical protein
MGGRVYPLFRAYIRQLQPQASHCNVSWMVARIWPGDIFFEKVLIIQVSGRPLGSGGGIMVEKHFYKFSEFVKVRKLYGCGPIKIRSFSQISGKTLLQLFRFCKSEKIIRCWADKSQIVLTNRAGKNFYHFSNLGKSDKSSMGRRWEAIGLCCVQAEVFRNISPT